MQGEHFFDLMQANRTQAMGSKVMFDKHQAMPAMFDKHQAIPAIIVRGSDEQALTMLAQMGAEETTSSAFVQTDRTQKVVYFPRLISRKHEHKQMLLSKNYTPNVSQIENENEISIEEYMLTR